MSSSIFVLGAVALIVFLVGFGFLIGLLRGFRKSLFFTIVFIVVVILSFIFATALAKSVYSGSTLWKVAKGVLPESMKEGSDGVNSLKEFIRFYLEKNYTEVLDNGMTAGQSIVANQNAMGIIDGLIVMIIKIVMLVGCYIFLSIIFYLLFGLIYLLFLRPKTYIETETTTDEDGNETVEEREIKPKKKRLLGGLIGGVKGFVKAMIILIPITFMIGIAAQIEIPTSSSSINSEIKLESGSRNKTVDDLLNACKTYDSSIGKIYLGLDDFVMDRIISYDVKGADGKKVKVTVRKELEGFIDIYNTIDKEIGIDNVKDYDFKHNLNSDEMKKVVEAITKNISESKATTTLLTAVGEEAGVILKSEASKNDSDMALIFEELNLKNKDNKWWKDQISQLNDIYVSFTNMNLDFDKVDTKEYNAIFANTTSESYEKFVDEIFSNELLEMLIDGSLKYAVKKLPENLEDVQEATNEVVEDKEVNKELKAFSKLIDIIRDDIKFKDGNVDIDSLTLGTLDNIVGTEVLVNSKIVGKLTSSLVKNAVSEITYNGELINYDKTIFDDANFSIHNELKNMVNVLTDGFTTNYSLGNLKDFQNTAYVNNVCSMLDSESLGNSKICHELFSKLLPMVLTVVTPTEDYTNINWKNEYPSISGILEHIYGKETLLSNIGNFDFDSMTYKRLDNLEKENKVWNGVVISKVLNGVALPFIEAINIDGSIIELDYDKDNIIWRNEIRSIVNIGLWSSDTNGVIEEDDYNNSVNSITTAFGDEVKVIVLKTLGEEIQDDKKTELLHAFANGAMKQFLGEDILDAKYECPALANVANILDDNTSDAYLAYGKIEISTIGNKTEDAMPEAQFKKLTTALSIEVANSKYLRNTLKDKIATDVDKDSWDSEKWASEMTSVDVICQDIDGDAEGNIKLSEISNSMNTLKDSMLINLQIETKTSLILQDIFADALLSNDMIKAKTDITNWSNEVDGLIPVVRTLEDENNKVELSKVSNLNEIYVSTVDELELVTHKSIVLMNTLAKNLSEPMSTPSMKNTDDTSAWSSTKWSLEMPRIGEVLKTLANDDDAIIIDKIQEDMEGEDSEIKRVTFERIELNIAYSEALGNMFSHTLEESLKDDTNPYIFPNPPAFSDELGYNKWWDSEITGLVNIIYKQMGSDDKLKLSDFNDTETVKVKVMKELYAKCFRTTGDEIIPMIKEYSETFSQETNIGVSQYLQYMFKPQLQNVSRRSTVETDPAYNDYYNFTDAFNWDLEMQPILSLFLGTQMPYDTTTESLVPLEDEDDITFGDVFFGLYDSGSKLKEDSDPMTGSEAALRNKTRLTEIKENIDGITYLQFILAPEMKKIMSADYMVENHTPFEWDNDDWIREMNNLDDIAEILITDTNPKMQNIDFYDLENSTIELICEKVKSSYILQSKMASPMVNAGINNENVTTEVTGSLTLMQYIVNYEWNEGINEAYEAIMDTFYNKLDALKAMKDNNFNVVGTDLVFYEEHELVNEIVRISVDGSVTDSLGNPYLTEDASTTLNAVKSYAEYNLIVGALEKSGNTFFATAKTAVITRANNLE